MKAKYLLSNLFRQGFGSQLRRNMVSGVFCSGINAVAMMVAYPVYLHFLGYEKYGVWLVLATVLSFAQLGNLGIGQAVIKLVAEEHGRKNIEGIQKYVVTAILILLISGSIALAAILVFKSHIIGLFNLSDENARIALWLLPYIGVLSIYVFVVQAMNATLSGLGRMDLANFAQALGRIVAVSIATLMLYRGNGIESILIGNSLSYIFIHLMSLVCIKRTTSLRFVRMSNICMVYGKKILTFGSHLFGSSLVAMLLVPFNKLIISRYIGVASVPIFEIAFNGSMQIRGLIEAGLRATMPEISRASAGMTKNGLDRIKSISRKSIKLILVFGLPAYALIMFASPWLLQLWLGDKYNISVGISFRIMLIGTYLSLIGVPAFYTLMGLGKGRDILFCNIIQSSVNVVIILSFIATGLSVGTNTVCVAVMAGMGGATLYLMTKQKMLFRNILSSELIPATPLNPNYSKSRG